ncbi:MAG: NCS2 family permease [Firmicutes bacterium]|nr:NCS2 family permease [Bacillota bacterium]
MEWVFILSKIDSYFHVTKSGSSLHTELFSGLTAYFTVVYILFLVPNTLMSAFPEAYDRSGEMIRTVVLSNGLTAQQMLVSLTILSCITAAIGTILLALKSNLPFAQGPSLSISTFVAYTICTRMGYTYNQALAAIFISGAAFFAITALGFEKKIQDAIPSNIKFAVTAGIGLFIAFMGMQKAHIVEGNSSHLVQMISFSNLGEYDVKSALLCLFGVILIAVMLVKDVHGAILWGKLIVIVIAIPLGLVHLQDFMVELPDIATMSRALRPDFVGLFTSSPGFGVAGTVVSVAVLISTLCVMDVFETLGAIIATDYIITLSHEGNINERFHKVLKVDSISTMIGSALGMTNVSTYVESTTMAIEGGRTGLSGLVASALFLLTIFIAPFASAIPSAATATTLIMSGILMMDVIKYINFDDVEQALPAFLTMAMMPLTYSLVTGIALGFISYTAMMIFTGKGRQINPGTFFLAVIFIIQFIMVH